MLPVTNNIFVLTISGLVGGSLLFVVLAFFSSFSTPAKAEDIFLNV